MIKILTAVPLLEPAVRGLRGYHQHQYLTITATVSNQATLTIGGGTTPSISFADSNPDTVPSIASTPAS